HCLSCPPHLHPHFSPFPYTTLFLSLNMTGIPLVMPPFIPPLLFETVMILPSSTVIGSLASEPLMSARSNPAPNSTPLTAGTEKRDRKSTRLNSSHVSISYAVFCLKK